MTVRAPSPLTAAVGLAATTAGELRRLPLRLVALPLDVVRQLAAAQHAARDRYEELAEHGRDVLAARRREVAAQASAAPDRAAALVDRAAATTAATAGRVADAVGERVGAVETVVDEVADRVAGAAEGVAEAAGQVADRVDRLDPTGDELAARAADAALERELAGTDVAPAPVTPIGRTEPVELPEDVLEEVAQLPSGAELDNDDLPLPNFDHLTVPQLRGRLRTLSVPELVQLRDYETAHGKRAPVLTLLDNRIAKLTESDTP
jgi:hypothetical protein